jgi:DNA repair exonuclease SbcCD ATPase subunit
LHKATSLPLQAQVSQASQRVEQVETRKRRTEEEFQLFLKQPPKPGFPPDFPKRIAQAKQAEAEARQALEAAQTRREQMREAIQRIGEAYHPYDLANAQAVQAAEVERRLEAQFAQIDRMAQEAQLSDGSRARIEKARRLIKSLVATIAFFHLQAQLWVSQLALSPEAERVVMNELIPALYLQRAAKKLPTTEQRAKVATVSDRILARIREPAGVLSSLPTEECAKVERVAQECADLFQRSSSCVEGRNGQLALRHHSLHRLTQGKLAALTVVHNYYVTRSDGTTAAERFFGSKPADLFTWLLYHQVVPARPAAKRRKTVQKAA